MPQRPQPSLRLADGGNFVARWAQNVMRPKNTEQRLRQIEAPPPAPVAQPAPPPPPPPNATPDNPAGIRFQDGGHVPGTGTGDKIPAKYEPGEFVVSNDMIDDNPGLREQLSGLRAETLAARGKTVEEADAKALNGGRRPSLRAQAGFNGSADPDFWRGNPNPLQGNQANQTLLDAARQRTDPVQSAAAQAANAPPPRAAPPTPPPGPTNPGMANPQARAAYADMARGSAPAAAPTAPAAGPGAAYGAARQAGQVAGAAKDWVLGSRPAATTALGKARNAGGAAMTAAGRVTGGLQVADTLRNNFDAMQNLARDENSSVSDYLAGGVEFIGNTVASGGAALSSKFPALGPIAAGFIGSDGASRFIDKMDPGASVLRRHGLGGESKVPGASVVPGLAEAVGTIAPTASARNTLSNPYANVTPEQGRAMAGVNAGAPGRAPGSQPTPQEAPFDFDTFEPGPGEGAFRNEQTGKVTRLTPTPQGATWRAVPSQRVTPAQQALVSPAPRLRQEVRAPVLNPNGGIFAAMADFTNQAGRATQAIAANKGLRNDRRDALDAESTFARIDQGDRALQISGREADIREKDLGLRREGQTASARFKQQELAYNRQRDALKDAMDIEKHTQTISHNATNNARDRLKGMAVRDDGKGGTVVDEGRLARLESTLTKMSPGWAQSGEATQAKLLRKAEASVNILEGLNNQRNNGWLQAFGIDGKNMQLDNLPHKEMKGAKLGEVGFVEGAKTPGTSHKDYVIETSGGHKLYLPRSSVNQGELELLKSLGVDVTGSKK